MRVAQRIFLILLLSMFARSIAAMGIRSFVVLPLEQGGMVFRLQDLHTLNNNNNVAIGNFAYGISGTQTLLGYQLKAGQHIILPIMVSKGYL